MFNTATRLLISILISFLFMTDASANDSDLVNCNRSWKIAILGSSTAYGTGASAYDSSWAGKFTAYVKRKNSQNEVYNLGIPGYTTYQNLCPTGFVPPANRPSPNNSFNITAALLLHPDAIIINMPSNDAANDYSIAEQQENFERALHLADSANVPVWVTTTQPRNNLSAAQVQNLVTTRDWIITRFGDKAVDFWTGVANADGTISQYYDYDYVHVNNNGHSLFYSRIKAETILDSLCARVTQTLVVRAGNDLSLTLPTNSITLDGSATYSSLGGVVTGYLWQQLSGPAASQIISSSNAVTAVNGLVEGRYSFLLTATDNASNTKSDTLNVVVSSRILIDFGPDLTASPDANGNYWNSIIETQPGIKLSSAVTTGNQSTNIGLQVINRIDGTFNPAGPGTNTGNSLGLLNDYPASATTDFSFAESSGSNGQWKITGLETAKQYTIKFWGTRTVADDRIIQIKRADQSNWQEYNAAGNGNYNIAAYFTFSGKTEMSFDIRVKSGSAFGYICIIDISRTAPAVSVNVPPFARANDVTVPLPATSALLDGSASGDDDGSITHYQWIQTSGPSSAVIVSPGLILTQVEDLVEGIYTFRLTVTDDSSATAYTDVTVTVNTRVLFDFGANLTTGPDAGGKYWNNVSDGHEGLKVANAVNTGNNATSINLEITSRIDGTFNPDGPGTNSGSISTNVGDYPASAVADYAFAHNSTVNGQWKFTGLDNSKQYTIKFWGTRDAADERVINIKVTGDSVWQQYDARNNTDYNNSAVFTFTGKNENSFDIKVKDDNTFGHISLVDIKITNPPVDCSPSVSIAADQPSAVCYGTAITFTATATNAGTQPVYIWKKNGIEISGAAASVYIASDLNNNDSISCTITANTNCGYGITASSNKVAALVLPAVVMGNISGPTDVCPLVGSTAVYTVEPVAGAHLYTWTVPTGTTILSGQGTTIITVSFTPNVGPTGVITVTGGTCSNAIPATLDLVRNVPAIPAPVSGPSSACSYLGTGVPVTYSVPAVPYATSYFWTVPANVTLVNGQGTNSISVLFSSSFTSSQISVMAVSNCFSSKNATLMVTATATATPGPISGPVESCPYIGTTATATYTIRTVPGALFYNWTVPVGAAITSHPGGTGINDTIIAVRFNSSFISGTLITVQSGGCIPSAASTLAVLKTAPATPGIITGPADACAYIGTVNQASYTTRKVAGATSYIWIVPGGVTVSSHPAGAGVNDTIIRVTFSSSFVSGSQISVQASSCLTSAASSIAVFKTAPAAPGAISGPTDVCPYIGSTATYTIRKVTGSTSYIWTVPAGVTVSSHPGGTGVNDTIIKLTFNSSFVSGTAITVQTSTCVPGGTSSLTLLKVAPAVPASLSGPAEACAYIGTTNLATYTARKVAGATSYLWTVPAGVTVSSHPAGTGVNDTIIRVLYNSSFVSGTSISVQAVSCLASAARSLVVTRPVPAAPAPINVIVSPCKYAGYAPAGGFSVAKLAGITYTWSAPLGSAIYHIGSTTGAADTVGIYFPITFTGGTVSVKASNGCGTSASTSVTVGVVVPATLSLILSGPADPCPYMGTGTGAVYKVKKVAGVAGYTWTVPSNGVTVTHPNGAGVNDTIIIVNFTSTFSSGSISVTANTVCGNSPVKTITLVKATAATPGTITTVSTASCPNRRYTYSIAAMPANATSINWTVPSGATILSGQGTLTITVSYPSTAVTGTVAAYGKNNCSTSSAKTVSVNLPKCTGSRGINEDEIEITVVKLPEPTKLTVMPNPSYGDFRIEVKGKDLGATGILRISDINGKAVETRTGIRPGQVIDLGAGYKAGIYIAAFIRGNSIVTIKLVKM